MSDAVKFQKDLIQRLTDSSTRKLDENLFNEVVATLKFVKDVVPDLLWELEATAKFLEENNGSAQLAFIKTLIARVKVATELL